jgi:hypothetical protein
MRFLAAALLVLALVGCARHESAEDNTPPPGGDDDDDNDNDDSDDTACDAAEGDWRTWVLAPPEELVYPVKATWFDLAGGSHEIDASLLQPGGDGVPLAAGSLVLDFGLNVAGFVELGVDGADALAFDLRFAEAAHFLFDTALRPYEFLTQFGMPFVWLPRYHRHELTGDAELQDPQQVGAFRYVRLDVASGLGALDYLRVRFTAARTTADQFAGYFLADDETLNRIWYASVYTRDLCDIDSGQGTTRADKTVGAGPRALIDGGRRDRLIWTADLWLGALVDFVARAGQSVTGDSLDYLAAHRRPNGALPASSPVGSVGLNAFRFLEYNPFWILSVWDQYLYTGDAAKLAERYPVVQQNLAYLASQTQDGLLVLNDANNGSWCWTLDRQGKGAFVNTLYYDALRKSADMARALGRAGDAADYDALAAATAAAIDALLWDDARGAYVESDLDRAHVPLDANALAIVVGLAAGKEDRIVAYLDEHHAGPYGFVNVDPRYGRTTYNVQFHNRRPIGFPNYFMAKALFQMGREAEAFDLLARCFGHMAAHDPASTMWEFIGADGEPEMSYVSLAHVWSAGAAPLLTQEALGVSPTAPGYANAEIRPRLGALTQAEGRVPTPLGPIAVKYRAKGHELLAILHVPVGMNAQFVIPAGYSEWEAIEGEAAEVEPGRLSLSTGGVCLRLTP